MDFAVLLYFDSQSEAKVQGLMQKLVDAGLNRMYLDMAMRPHVTVAQVDAQDHDRIEETIRGLSQSLQGLKLNLNSSGFFTGEDGVLFLSPTPSEALLQVHDEVQEALQPHAHSFSPFYVREQWVPHCTLALQLTAQELQMAYGVLSDHFTPFQATVEQIGLIRCCPYREHMTCSIQG